MRPIAGVLALLAALALAAPAVAKRHVLAPPGNSGVSQYVESIPTAQGNQPTSSVHLGGGGSGGGSGPSAGSAISASTQHSLAAQGQLGKSAAAVLTATAPRSRHHGGSRASVPAIAQVSTSSPASSVLKTLTGSSSSGGLGLLLPIILVGSLVVISALAVLRRRRPTS